MVSVVLAGCSRVVGLVGGFGCGVKCLRSNQNSLLAIWGQDDQVQGDLRCRSSKLSTYPLILSRFLYQDVVTVGILATRFYSASHKRQPRSFAVGIVESNKQNEICPDGSDQLPANKRDVLLALDNIQAPSVRVTNPEHDHVDKEVLVVADTGSVRADEMPRGSTDAFDDNLWREGRENTCAIIQGLSPNAHIHAHANNDLPWPYATETIVFVSRVEIGWRNKKIGFFDEQIFGLMKTPVMFAVSLYRVNRFSNIDL
ncbi:hypothetical protein Tco_0098663 [Tanacetum coccineum]